MPAMTHRVDGMTRGPLDRQLSRRRFLRDLGVLSAGISAGPVLLSCTSSTSSSSTSSAWAKSPVTFVFAVDGDADHIDPGTVFDFESFQVTRNRSEEHTSELQSQFH